jgi:threonyl-tRNA synthetase
MPECFDLTYIGEDGEKHRPVMIHRVAFGSIERFLGILTEHYAGAFPAWLAPVQARVITVADRHLPFAAEVAASLEEKGFRVEVDDRNERVGYKIRDGELEKVPYLLVVGDKETEARAVSVRKRGQGDLGRIPMAEFAGQLAGEVAQKK